MSKLDKDDVLAKFTEAYKTVNGKEPQVEMKSGWYSVDGGKNIRLAQLAEMTEELTGSTSESPSEIAEEPKAIKETPAKNKASVSTGNSFSVKDFWVTKIREENSGSISPR